MNEHEKMPRYIHTELTGSARIATDQIRRIDELQSAISESVQRMQDVAQAAFRGLSRASDEIKRAVQRPFNQLPTIITPILKDFAQHGWYINYTFDFIQIAEAKNILTSGDETAFDNFMAEIVAQKVEDYIVKIGNKHSNRKLVCTQALQAHQAGLYFTSIPTIFAQIDGLTEELTGYKFFENDRKTHMPKIAQWAETAGTFSLEVALLSVLLDKGAFQKYKTQANRIAVTRHSILHGETPDYGTKTNSLKAFSRLMFVSDMWSPRETPIMP